MRTTPHNLEPVIGHSNSITSLAFSPDGKTLASGSYDRTAVLWEVETGDICQTLRHKEGVSEVSFSPDGRVLATAAWEVSLWRAESGKRIRRLPGTHLVAFSPDGALLATMGENPETVQLWEVRKGKLLQTLTGHRGQAECLAFSPDGGLLAVGDIGGGIRLWQVRTGKVTWTLSPARGGIPALAFSPDGARLAAGLRLGGARGTTSLMVWDVPSRTLVWQAGDYGVGWSKTLSVAFSTEGRRLTGGCDDGCVRVWDAETGALLQSMSGQRWLRAVAFSPDSKLLASAGDDKFVRLWDTKTWSLVRRLGGWFGEVRSVTVAPRGTTIISGDEDGTIRQWHTRTGKLQRVVPQYPGTAVTCLSLSRNGRRLATGSCGSGCGFQVWEIGSRGSIRQRMIGETPSTSVALAPNGVFLASKNREGVVCLRSAGTGLLLQTLPAPPGVAEFWWTQSDLAFSPDGKVLAVNYHETIGLWKVASGTMWNVLSYPVGKDHDHFVSLAFSPDGQWLAAGCMGFRLALWHLATGNCCRVLVIHRDSVGAIAFSPDSTLLAIGTDYEETVALWDVQNGRQVKQLHGHRSAIRALAFLPDGRLVSGSADGTLRVWEVTTGEWQKAMRVLPPREGQEVATDWIAFTPDGAWVGSNRAKQLVLQGA